MKKLILSLAILMPVLASAQTVLTPEQQLEKAKQEARAAKRAVAEAKAAAKKAAKEAKKKQKSTEAEAAEARKKAEIERQIEAARVEKQRYEAELKTIEETKKQAVATELKTIEEVKKEATVAEAAANQATIPAATEWNTPTDQLDQVSIARAAGPEIPKNDPRYLAGKVPQDADGKVVFSINYDIEGKSAAEIQQRIAAVFAWKAKQEGQLNSRVVLDNSDEHTVAAVFSEWLVFSKSYLSLDRTMFNYTLIAKCSDGHMALTMERMSYDYERGRPAHLATTAEDWITDKVALNKRKDKLVNGPAKFRRATIDRKNQLFIDIYDLMR